MNLLVQGLVITVPNPKSLIFIAAFLPQFIDATRPLGMQFIYIVPTFLVITFSVTSIWATIAGNVSAFLQGQRAFQSVFLFFEPFHTLLQNLESHQNCLFKNMNDATNDVGAQSPC